MNSSALESPMGKFRTWVILAVLIFVAQLGLIYVLSTPGIAASPEFSAKTTAIYLASDRLTETQFSQDFLASDPTLFASANSDGFSGPAWLKSPSQEYNKIDFAERVEPFWLALNPKRLGIGITHFVQTNSATLVPIVERSLPPVQAAVIPDETKQKRESRLRIEGGLAAREIITFANLRSWAHTNLLSNSVVQISVDKDGLVLSPRLLSRSGLDEADNSALDLASIMRFSRDKNAEISWGKLIFDWHTVVSTNSEQKVAAP